MEQICPACKSQKIKGIHDSAHYLGDDRPVTYTDGEPENFACEACGHQWNNKK